MNWERVKNFLIILFIAINIFLVGFMFNSIRMGTAVTEDVIGDTVYLLNNNGIAIDSNIIPMSVEAPDSFDVMPITVESIYESPVPLDDTNTASQIKKALKASGVKGYEIISKDSGTYYILQKLYGHYMFGDGVTAVVSGNTISLSGVWYKAQTKPNRKGDAIPVTAVLIDFMNNPARDAQAHNQITNIEMGYCVPTYGSGENHKSMPAVPGYYITTSGGTSFVYEATSGTYIKSK